jgi:putative ABC transport system substrate-binding protein
MRRFASSLVLASVLFGMSIPAEAQQPGRFYRVAFLWGPVDDPVDSDKWLAARLASRGFVSGRNIEILTIYSDGSTEELTAEARSLIAKKPDVIVVQGTSRTRILQSLTTTIPIVFEVGDPIHADLVKDLARPGGNATGVSTQECALIEKRRELLRALAPNARRVTFIASRPQVGSHPCQEAIDALTGVRLLNLEPAGGEPAARANLQAVLRANPDAILTMGTYPGMDEILATLSMKRRVPIVSDDNVDRPGVLGSVHSDPDEPFDLDLDQMMKILNGARPGDLPVMLTTRFHAEINLRLANQLGLRVPESVIVRADRVVR